MDLVLSRALHAVTAPIRTADVSYGSTTDVTDAAADAVRAICSFSTSAGEPLAAARLFYCARLHMRSATYVLVTLSWYPCEGHSL